MRQIIFFHFTTQSFKQKNEAKVVLRGWRFGLVRRGAGRDGCLGKEKTSTSVPFSLWKIISTRTVHQSRAALPVLWRKSERNEELTNGPETVKAVYSGPRGICLFQLVARS